MATTKESKWLLREWTNTNVTKLIPFDETQSHPFTVPATGAAGDFKKNNNYGGLNERYACSRYRPVGYLSKI
ncbi:MAG: hypothetical protein GY765_17920 [bacterium]|nr:hypothetical protein [bacterium]